MRRNNLKSLAQNFQVAIHFYPGYLQPDTCSQLQYINMAIVNKTGPVVFGFSRRKHMVWLFKEGLKIRDRATLRKSLTAGNMTV